MIAVEAVSKLYRLYERPVDRLKEALNPFGKKYHNDFHALRDVSLDVYPGETVGVIGRNGSGKSTLLKIISGVLSPSRGRVSVRGRVSALLELGLGFNPEFSGLENLRLQGLMMGYTAAEMGAREPSIVEFADIGEFIHQPIKQYSSGMLVRLAFACAINVDPEILIVDEALAVGDVFFQNKCFHRLHEFREQGKTILFVSHDLGLVKQLCSRVLWLDGAKGVMCGGKNEVCQAYFNRLLAETRNAESGASTEGAVHAVHPATARVFPGLPVGAGNGFATGEAEILSFYMGEPGGAAPLSVLHTGQDYEFHILGKINADIPDLIFGVVLENSRGITVLAANTFAPHDKRIEGHKGDIMESVLRFRLPSFQKGDYLVSPAIARGTQLQHTMLTWLHNASAVRIENPGYNLALLEVDHTVEVRIDAPDQLVVR